VPVAERETARAQRIRDAAEQSGLGAPEIGAAAVGELPMLFAPCP
jgi:hypothetical protein